MPISDDRSINKTPEQGAVTSALIPLPPTSYGKCHCYYFVRENSSHGIREGLGQLPT